MKFSDFKSGDTIWAVYDENYKDYNYSQPYNVKKILRPAIITKNTKVTREIISNNYYDDDTRNIISYNIEIQLNIYKYSRNYEDFYDNRARMTITPEVWSNGPIIEVFVNKEDAIEYIEEICKNRIEDLKKEIENMQNQIELCKQSIINAKKNL